MKKRLYATVLMLTLSVSMLSGCSGKKDDPTNAPAKTESKNDYDPFGKYVEPITVTGVLSFSPAGKDVKGNPTPEDNPFFTVAKKRLNIDFKWLWTAPSEQYQQKLGVAMASSLLPDVLSVNAVDYENLLQNEQIMPWNEALKYASDTFKEWIYREELPWKTSTLENGDIMGIPIYTDPKRNLNIMMIRTDWLEDVGMDIPKTTEEFEKVCKAFIEKKGAYVGFDMLKNVLGGTAGLSSFANMFGSYPGKWIKDANGKLIPGEIQPETKYALNTLHKWYEEGIIDREYSINTSTELKENILQEKTGILIAPWWAMDAYVGSEISKNKDSKWASAPIPKKEGTKGAILDRLSLSDYWVLNKNCQNPSAVVKLFNLWCEFETNVPPEGKPENGHVWNWVPTRYFDPYDIQKYHDNFNAQVQTGDLKTLPKGFNINDKVLWDDVEEYFKWKKGEATYPDTNIWGKYLGRYDKDFAWGTTMKVVENNEYETNEFYGIATDTMILRKSTLDKLTEEVFTKIVMGELPIDAFDKYTKDWLNLGGEDIIVEVNDWYNQK